MTEEQILTRSEAAAHIHRTRATLARWSRNGQGPVFIETPGGRALYRLSDIEAWLRSRERGSNTEEETREDQDHQG